MYFFQRNVLGAFARRHLGGFSHMLPNSQYLAVNLVKSFILGHRIRLASKRIGQPILLH